jgi:hypothetical protein
VETRSDYRSGNTSARDDRLSKRNGWRDHNAFRLSGGSFLNKGEKPIHASSIDFDSLEMDSNDLLQLKLTTSTEVNYFIP